MDSTVTAQNNVATNLPLAAESSAPQVQVLLNPLGDNTNNLVTRAECHTPSGDDKVSLATALPIVTFTAAPTSHIAPQLQVIPLRAATLANDVTIVLVAEAL
ncbi:hypothetical protein ACLOJK_029986 [Asimina triloba]